MNLEESRKFVKEYGEIIRESGNIIGESLKVPFKTILQGLSNEVKVEQILQQSLDYEDIEYYMSVKRQLDLLKQKEELLRDQENKLNDLKSEMP